MTPITSMDLTGFTEREPGVWTDEQGLVLSLHFFDLVPDLPAPLDEPDRLRYGLAHSAAQAGGGLIEALLGEVDGVPAVRQLIKIPRPHGHGLVFIGSWTVPRAGCSTVVKVQAAEAGTTGVREAVVMSQLDPQHYFTPHPYGPDITGGLPYLAADHPQWDAQFPHHPLTLVRTTLERLTPTLTLHDGFKALPPFASGSRPEPPRGDSGPRRWFRRRG
ncbi:hypothetical protein GCM10010218_62580 [Streptomyces mashuensis]|uniref:Uncharacterized protein n=1 Tax=Streptomyces mashuensis TaxID=33904 RepID=A0A919BAK5_9ACTN|nr:hypothetical protein [Streptomyces mashuensis]GHF72868.1 hypothetical protein GCM10010218_62580 [Streptomyces mashuensis]